MQSKRTLSELRNNLEKIMAQISAANQGEVSNADAIEKLIFSNESLVRELQPQLLKIALTKLANEVGSRKGPKPVNNLGFNLFGEYQGVPKMIALRRGKKRDTSKATFQEADLWLKAHDLEVTKQHIRNAGFKRLVEECRPFATSFGDTLEQALEKKLEAEGKLNQLPL